MVHLESIFLAGHTADLWLKFNYISICKSVWGKHYNHFVEKYSYDRRFVRFWARLDKKNQLLLTREFLLHHKNISEQDLQLCLQITNWVWEELGVSELYKQVGLNLFDFEQLEELMDDFVDNNITILTFDFSGFLYSLTENQQDNIYSMYIKNNR